MEKDYLTSSWDLTKVLLGLTIPVFFIGLGTALWKRSLPFRLAILVLDAVGKTIWSLTAGGNAGRAVLVPAGIGLVLGLGLERVVRSVNRTESLLAEFQGRQIISAAGSPGLQVEGDGF